MNALRPEPVKPLPYRDGEVLHASTRTAMSTNAEGGQDTPARLTIATSRLEMRVVGGCVEIRFSEHRVDGLPARPASNRPAFRRVR